ncbi:hypothetical protein EJ02DRAFT_415327 [Clathrospora elynae]|uniref:Ecp2 effector protein-like domain-containing protein n=1 Tax=Clathrospora elynae TaxID=706981 RepID=A0A6A5S747_9PLEO|nr:hypothetical protein EJ02DRAFT_415327 [Clathrospora elynae]
MQYHLLPIIAAFLAVTQASPVAFNLVARKSVNDCGDSTFINQSSDGSPLISDCQQIASNIAGGGTWTVADGQHQLVQFGTCAFGVQPYDGLNFAYIGNQDIIDLINESIRRFSYNGKVGSKGEMGCQSGQGLVGGVDVNWGLYHN